MTTYAVTMTSPEDAAFLADRQGNHFHLRATGTTVTFDDAARAWLADRPANDDGHIDENGALWFGGDPYQIASR